MYPRDLAARWTLIVACVAAASVVTGCNDSSSPTTQLRAIHASADAPNVDVIVNGTKVLSDVAYETASGFLSLPAGATTVTVNPLEPRPASSAPR